MHKSYKSDYASNTSLQVQDIKEDEASESSDDEDYNRQVLLSGSDED
jgi:hypothetical protein